MPSLDLLVRGAEVVGSVGARLFEEVRSLQTKGNVSRVKATASELGANSLPYSPEIVDYKRRDLTPLSKAISDGISGFTKEGFLVDGIHRVANWHDLSSTFGFNSHRRTMLTRFNPIFQDMQRSGMDHLYIGGSFVTNKEKPNDIDAVVTGQTEFRQRFQALHNDATAIANRFGATIFSEQPNTQEESMIDYFRRSRVGTNRGIVQIPLRDGLK